MENNPTLIFAQKYSVYCRKSHRFCSSKFSWR